MVNLCVRHNPCGSKSLSVALIFCYASNFPAVAAELERPHRTPNERIREQAGRSESRCPRKPFSPAKLTGGSLAPVRPSSSLRILEIAKTLTDYWIKLKIDALASGMGEYAVRCNTCKPSLLLKR